MVTITSEDLAGVGTAREMAKEMKARQVMEGRMAWWRELMKSGRNQKAAEYAERYRLPVGEELGRIEEEQQKLAKKARGEDEAKPGPDLKVEVPGAVPVEVAVEVKVAEREEVKMEVRPVEILPEAEVVVVKNGWPVQAVGEVIRYPLNKRMVVVKLVDGREARCWNVNGARAKFGTKGRIRLVEAEGDPIYEWAGRVEAP